MGMDDQTPQPPPPHPPPRRRYRVEIVEYLDDEEAARETHAVTIGALARVRRALARGDA